ncbi:hypothetical protein ACTVZO_07855 [Streptomyces sp. IBSNAI002]|uniref:hypothetical protein n=1 Tax=Streptomyces sp. IBSNAI002 TaxID=3457500 RepID=UPI003FD02F4F
MLGGGLGDASARLVLLQGVSLLRPEDVVFEAMMEGWARQQRGGRRLQAKTIGDRRRVVERFAEFANTFPWQWTAGDLDEWMTHLIGVLHGAESTIRGYQGAIRMFCDYITSPHYQWPAECEERFGMHPVQICHEWNTVAHLVECEGRPGRRPMTRAELQAFFDYADDQVERAVRLVVRGPWRPTGMRRFSRSCTGGGAGARRPRGWRPWISIATRRRRSSESSVPCTCGTGSGRRARPGGGGLRCR